MSIKPVSDSQATMNLGVVTIQGQRYAAILHFKTDEGDNRAITQNMFATRDVALRLFQDVITPYNQSKVVEKVSEFGFFEGSEEIMSHENLNTTEAWQKFIRHLNNPQKLEDDEEAIEEIEKGTHVELVDLSPLDDIQDDKAFARALYEKIRAHHEAYKDETLPELNALEKLFLGHGVTFIYPKFLAGEFDARELNNLFIEAGLSRD